MIARGRLRWLGEVRQMSAIGTKPSYQQHADASAIELTTAILGKGPHRRRRATGFLWKLLASRRKMGRVFLWSQTGDRLDPRLAKARRRRSNVRLTHRLPGR